MGDKMKTTTIREFILNKQKLCFILANICFTILCVFIISNAVYGNKRLTMKIDYGDTYSDKYYAQLFYSETEDDMNENDSFKSFFNDNIIELKSNLSVSEYQKYLLRLDPTNSKENFSIKRVKIVYRGNELISINGKQFADYISGARNSDIEVSGNDLKVSSNTGDCRFILDSKFNQRIIDKCINKDLNSFYVFIILYFVLGFLQFFVGKKQESKKTRFVDNIKILLTIVLVALGSSLVYGEAYLSENFDDVPLGQLLYHLHTPLDGTNTSSFTSIIVSVVLIILLCVLVVLFGYWGLGVLKKRTTFLNWMSLLGCIEIAYAVVLVCFHFDAINYFKYVNQETKIYEENYVDGRDVKLSFPNEKRNLIYIFLESMEMTYADKSVGGAMQDNYIPELTDISKENESFGINGQLNGAYTVPGATFTMGGLVAQTSGVPINENIVSNDSLNSEWESENNYVPGVWSIGDVLKKEGYNQEFMIGSDGKFAGRSSYFHGHGDYNVFDYYTAIDRGYIDSDYRVWWGYEDEKLFEYAKSEITDLANDEKPFNFTMLTVDTHFTDGYVCELCQNQYDEQYSNVITCSSSQVAEFLDWIKQQDFYDNTTVVISGDHLTMDSDYIERNNASDFDRKTYFTIVNGAATNEKPCVNREYTTLDLYPTTLAALGVQIEGNRLGLGTNLYSGKKTLAEKYGLDYLNVELLKDSKLYRKKLLYGNK